MIINNFFFSIKLISYKFYYKSRTIDSKLPFLVILPVNDNYLVHVIMCKMMHYDIMYVCTHNHSCCHVGDSAVTCECG